MFDLFLNIDYIYMFFAFMLASETNFCSDGLNTCTCISQNLNYGSGTFNPEKYKIYNFPKNCLHNHIIK